MNSYRSNLSFVIIDQYLTELWPLDSEFSWKFVFRTFFGLILKILKWNLVWLFTIMSYRSSLSFVVIDLYLTKLWALGLRNFMKMSVFRTFFGLILQILKWNLVWLFTIMSYRSSVGFVVTDQYLTELWALRLRIFMKICFPDIFWINFADIEMKLGMIVYNNELQIKFEFCRYWSIFDRVMALGLRIFMKNLFSGYIF
jgi:hypothetical protein